MISSSSEVRKRSAGPTGSSMTSVTPATVTTTTVATPTMSTSRPATAVLRTRSRTTARMPANTLQTRAAPGQTYPIKVLCARDYSNYRFSIPTENTVSDSVSLMSEQILQDLATKGTIVPKRVTTNCFPAMFESATVADWGTQNSNHPPLLLMEAQADLTESQARVGEVPGAAQNLGIYEEAGAADGGDSEPGPT